MLDGTLLHGLAFVCLVNFNGSGKGTAVVLLLKCVCPRNGMLTAIVIITLWFPTLSIQAGVGQKGGGVARRCGTKMNYGIPGALKPCQDST